MTGPLGFFHNELMTIWVHADRLVATVFKKVGTFEVHQTVEKVYPHIEDLQDLPLRGIKQLATEFYNEVKQTITN